jgi:hypothetical protein
LDLLVSVIGFDRITTYLDSYVPTGRLMNDLD